jgi:uncharacterized membrane protein
MKNNIEYRLRAIELMKGRYLNVFVVLAVFSIILGAISGISAGYSPLRDPMTLEIINPGNPGLSSLFNILAFVFSSYASYSFLVMFIGITKETNPDLEALFLLGPKQHLVKLPVVLFISNIFIFLYTLLLIIPGIIKAYAYSLNLYILNQEPEIDATQVHKRSEMLMSGKKMSLFLLDVSYLGWYFLSIFTLGILLVWVIPKHHTARTLFMMDAYQQN